MLRRPKLARVVVYDGGPNNWTAKVYDEEGYLRSGITAPSSQEWVERKIAEWYPGLPVERKSTKVRSTR